MAPTTKPKPRKKPAKPAPRYKKKSTKSTKSLKSTKSTKSPIIKPQPDKYKQNMRRYDKGELTAMPYYKAYGLTKAEGDAARAAVRKTTSVTDHSIENMVDIVNTEHDDTILAGLRLLVEERRLALLSAQDDLSHATAALASFSKTQALA